MSITSQNPSIIIAGGTTHDSWPKYSEIVFARANEAYKWDTSGKRYIDFWMGHGSLLLGHNHPVVIEAIIKQVRLGTHLSGNHTLLLEWAEKIIDLVPSAEQVRFCSSGTEATLLALRLARAFTGRSDVLRIDGHFHGWHDESLSGSIIGWPRGQHPASEANLHILPPYEVSELTSLLSERKIAAVILEPGGGSSGVLPMDINWLHQLRDETNKYGTLLIFDEVMSGFRYAPGGAQSIANIFPDITTLSKVLCGGLPGAAVVGRKDIMDCFDVTHPRKVTHSGTFNGNPLSASAGVAALNEVTDGEIQKNVTDNTRFFVDRVNEQAEKYRVDIRLFHQSSIFHLVIGSYTNGISAKPSKEMFMLINDYSSAYQQLHQLLIGNGIDMHRSHGWLSNSHTIQILNEAIHKFSSVFKLISTKKNINIPTY